jgi:hypothetical protein
MLRALGAEIARRPTRQRVARLRSALHMTRRCTGSNASKVLVSAERASRIRRHTSADLSGGKSLACASRDRPVWSQEPDPIVDAHCPWASDRYGRRCLQSPQNGILVGLLMYVTATAGSVSSKVTGGSRGLGTEIGGPPGGIRRRSLPRAGHARPAHTSCGGNGERGGRCANEPKAAAVIRSRIAGLMLNRFQLETGRVGKEGLDTTRGRSHVPSTIEHF